MNQELRLLLELNEADTREWLASEGLDEQALRARCHAVDARTAYKGPTPVAHQTYEGSASAPSIAGESQCYVGAAYPDQAFRATVAAEDIEVSTIVAATVAYSGSGLSPAATTATSSLPEPERSYRLVDSDEDRAAIGRWCEVFVNRLLTQESERFARVEWAKEAGESGKPYDFKVLEHGVEKYIEVKGTPSADKDELYFSTLEWKLLFEQQERYAIYRVFNAGESTAWLVVIEHPSAQLIKGKLLPARITLKL